MAMKSSGTASCTLNGVVIEVDDDATVRVGAQPFVYKDEIDALRAAHRTTHFFKRERNQIVSVALEAGCDPIGDECSQRHLQQTPSLIAPLALDALLRYFHTRRRPIWRYKPLRIVADSPGDRLLTRALPKGVMLPSWLEQRISYVFDTRTVYPESQPPAVLLACDVKTCNFITAPCHDLLSAGIDIIGRYVQTLPASNDPRLSPKPRLVGQVVRIEGSTLVLDDHVEDCATVQATDAFLEPRQENLAWCIQQLYPKVAGEILARLEALAAAVNRGPERLRRIERMFDHLRSVPLELAPSVPFRLGPLLRQTAKTRATGTTWFPRHELTSRPVLVFDPGRNRTDVWSERGIDKHGPYDQRYFTPKRPRIAVICQAEAQGQVEQFVRKFLDGMPDILVGRRRPYEKGFVRRYMLETADVTVFPAVTADAEAYRAACRLALQDATNRGEEWHLALVQIDDASHLLRGREDPYLVTKSMFMKRQVPVQEVTLEKMTAPAADLVFILNDISLAAYAKLGGTPWLLPADTTITHELVIGLGSYQPSGSRIGAKERVVGITTVFTGDGRYLLESRTATVPYDEYADALLATLRLALETVRRDQNWYVSDAIRLIFHAFKPLKDMEVDAVTQVVEALGLPNAEFAFLHLADDHPFLVFDEQSAGSPYKGEHKGAFAPERGTLIKLNRDELLISLTGPREVKQASDGLPRPVLLKLHRKSTFKDMTYLARQAFAFSCQSWRGFGLASMPITILYSQLMARLLRKLADVPDWDPEAMLGKIGRTRWFL